jgi:hypothetical protein
LIALKYHGRVKLRVKLDREDDGRWIAEVIELPGVMCYGKVLRVGNAVSDDFDREALGVTG